MIAQLLPLPLQLGAPTAVTEEVEVEEVVVEEVVVVVVLGSGVLIEVAGGDDAGGF